MKSDIHKFNIPIVSLGNPLPFRHCSLCLKGAAIDRNNQYKLIDKGRWFKAGEILVRQDEAADTLFVIHGGYCRSSVECGDNVFISRFYALGDTMVLDVIEGGEYLTAIKVATAAEVCHIDIVWLFKVADKKPLVAAAVIEFLCRDNGFIVEKLRRYANKHTEARVVVFLVEFYEMHLCIDRPETTLRLSLSRDETVSYLDLKAETVSRSLKSPEQQNLTTLHRARTVAINSYPGLERLT